MDVSATLHPCSPSLDLRRQIEEKAEREARLYLSSVDIGEPSTRETKEIIEGLVSTNYDGRTVVELLQNGHDAHARGARDGVVEILLDEDEGDHGVLYVANQGLPLDGE